MILNFNYNSWLTIQCASIRAPINGGKQFVQSIPPDHWNRQNFTIRNHHQITMPNGDQWKCMRITNCARTKYYNDNQKYHYCNSTIIMNIESVWWTLKNHITRRIKKLMIPSRWNLYINIYIRHIMLYIQSPDFYSE